MFQNCCSTIERIGLNLATAAISPASRSIRRAARSAANRPADAYNWTSAATETRGVAWIVLVSCCAVRSSTAPDGGGFHTGLPCPDPGRRNDRILHELRTLDRPRANQVRLLRDRAWPAHRLNCRRRRGQGMAWRIGIGGAFTDVALVHEASLRGEQIPERESGRVGGKRRVDAALAGGAVRARSLVAIQASPVPPPAPERHRIGYGTKRATRLRPRGRSPVRRLQGRRRRPGRAPFRHPCA